MEVVKKESALSGFDQKTRAEFLEALEIFKQEMELEDQLKEKPLRESEIELFLKRGSEDKKEWAERFSKFRPLIDKFRSSGLIVPDPLLSYGEFCEANPTCNILKMSLMQQMSVQEFGAFRLLAKPMKLFVDLIPGTQTLHYAYYTGFGGERKVTGEGVQIQVKDLEIVIPDTRKHKQIIAERERYYATSRKEIAELLRKVGIIPKEDDQNKLGGQFKINGDGTMPKTKERPSGNLM